MYFKPNLSATSVLIIVNKHKIIKVKFLINNSKDTLLVSYKYSQKMDNKSGRNMSQNKPKIKRCCATSWY